MKKIVSLLIALVLCVSLCCVSAVAFAATESAAKTDLVGAWADDAGSRIKFTEKEFSGTIKYEETSDGDNPVTTTKTVSIAATKYTYSGGNFEVTDDITEKEWTVSYTDNKIVFVVTKKSDAEAESTTSYTVTLTRRTISYIDTAWKEVTTKVDKVQGASEHFKFNYAWLADEAKVASVFQGISYTLKFGNWKATWTSDTAMEIEWKQNDVTKTATIAKTEGSDSDNKFVGTWEGTLAGKSVKLVFTTQKVAVTRDGLTLGSVDYKTEGDVATFTTGDSAKPYAVAEGSDKVYVQYATPTVDYKDFSSWNTVEIGTDINIIGTTSSTSRIGWWVFRFVVRDSAGTVLTDDSGNEIRSDRIDIYFSDDSAPAYRENNGLTTDMITVRDNGLTVGSTYTIKTNLRYIDNGSVTVNYKVYKWDSKKGDWTKDPILVKGESVAEGYEDCITSAGVITPLKSDILKDKKPVYRIVYSLVDDQNYESETTTLDLFVKAPTDNSPASATDVWKIVLYVIAGLSAVGIVVVLCIKPKKPEVEDARVVGGDASASDNKGDKKVDGEDKLDE